MVEALSLSFRDQMSIFLSFFAEIRHIIRSESDDAKKDIFCIVILSFSWNAYGWNGQDLSLWEYSFGYFPDSAQKFAPIKRKRFLFLSEILRKGFEAVGVFFFFFFLCITDNFVNV